MVTVEVERSKIRAITVEPIILGTNLTQSISAAVIIELTLRQACHSHGVSLGNCSANSTIENESQTQAANIQAIVSIISNMIPVLLCLVVGPWSDTNGRKPFLAMAVFGVFAQWVMYIVLASLESLTPMALITPSFILMLTGGQPVVSMLTFCYLADASSEMNKAFRMGIGMTSAVVANCVGPLIASWIYSDGTYYGYIAAFAACAVLQFLVALYTILGLPEIIKVDKDKRQRMFTVKHLLGTYNFFRRKRPIRQILLITLIILVIGESSVMFSSENEVYFLSLKKKLQWDVDAYSKFTAVSKAINCLYMTLGIWFMCSFLKFPDSIASLIAFVAHTVGMIIFVTSNSSTSVYVANMVGVAGRMVQPIYMAMFTKAVNHDETGSALTIATVFGSITIPLCSLLYAAIYGLVVSNNPFEVYYLPAAAAALGVITALGIRYFERNKRPSIDLRRLDVTANTRNG